MLPTLLSLVTARTSIVRCLRVLSCVCVLCVRDDSLGSALHARASSIRNVKLPLGRQNTAKRSSGHTPGSVGGSAAAGEEKEKEGDFDGVSGAAMASAEAGDSGKPKAVAWGEGGGEAAEKVEKVGARIIMTVGAVFWYIWYQHFLIHWPTLN